MAVKKFCPSNYMKKKLNLKLFKLGGHILV